MYTNILIATDGSEIATKALQHATNLAKLVGAKLTAITVTEPYEAIAFAGGEMIYAPQDYDKYVSAHADGVLAAARQSVGTAAPLTTLHVENNYPYVAICDTAKEIGADLIVMGSHGRRGIEGFLLGSQAQKVLTHTDIAALIVR